MNALPRHIRLLSKDLNLDNSNYCFKVKNLTYDQRLSFEQLLSKSICSVKYLDTDFVISGFRSSFVELNADLAGQPELKVISDEMTRILEHKHPSRFTWKIKNRAIQLGERSHIMGILNVTQDSFFDGGKYFEKSKAVEHALKMIEDGADMIDIGGESTRPGSLPVSEEQEINHVVPVIEALRLQSDITISIDTQKSKVAQLAIEAGADIINDISGLGNDPKIAELAADTGAGLILMHIKGTPRDMQRNPDYDDVIEEILLFLNHSRNRAFEWGVRPDQIVVDPGIGFGKRWFDNYDIINRLQEIQLLHSPILIGASRKSFLNQVLPSDPAEKLEGSLAAHILAIENGASILRVHDVKETKKAALVVDLFLERKRKISLGDSKTQTSNF